MQKGTLATLLILGRVQGLGVVQVFGFRVCGPGVAVGGWRWCRLVMLAKLARVTHSSLRVVARACGRYTSTYFGYCPHSVADV